MTDSPEDRAARERAEKALERWNQYRHLYPACDEELAALAHDVLRLLDECARLRQETRLARARFVVGTPLHEGIDALLLSENEAKDRAEEAEAENTRLRALLRIENLRQYHDLSLADPPSAHYDKAETLDQCEMCVDKFLELAAEAALTREEKP